MASFSDETLPAYQSPSLEEGADDGSPLPFVGEVVLGRYRIEGELGRGGQAVVFKALDLQLDRHVALKVLASSIQNSKKDSWQGLLEEARLQAAVEVNGVARLLDVQKEGENSYLVMELVPGKDLKDIFIEVCARANASGLPPKDGSWLADAAGLLPDSQSYKKLQALNWSRAVAYLGNMLAESVFSLHQLGMIHRDLKPGNIKLSESGEPVVLDFGLARWLGEPRDSRLAGTIGYLAPEQFPKNDRRELKIDGRTDLFQIGLILFELLALERAYPIALLRDLNRYEQVVRSCPLRSVQAINGKVDVGLAAIIAKATSIHPDDRYPSLKEFAEDLLRVQQNLAPKHVATPAIFRARRFAIHAALSPIGLVGLASLFLIPMVWAFSAALIQDVTSLEGWRFSSDAAVVSKIGADSKISVGDDLGVRVSNSKPTILYALSVYGGDHPDARYLSPMHSVPLVEGVLQDASDSLWGLALSAGEHEVVCTRIYEANPYEGLLVFACAGRVPILEDWMALLHDREISSSVAVSQAKAFSLLDSLQAPVTIRGGSPRRRPGELNEAEVALERERYASFSAAKAAGKEEWDLGTDIVRMEFLCEVDF